MKRLLALILASIMLVGVCGTLASCVNDNPNESSGTTDPNTTESSAETSSKETDTSDTSSTESTSTETTETTETTATTEETFAPDTSVIYNDGPEVNEAGIDWESGFFANVKHTIDKSAAKSITADELLAKMVNRDGENALKAGEVWIVTDAIKFEENTKYYGNGAVIIAEGGINIRNTVGVVVKNVIIEGSMNIKNSAELIFHKVDIKNDGTTITIDSNSSDISFNNCRIQSNNVSLKSGASYLTIYSSYIKAPKGAQLTGDDVTVQNCKIYGATNAISVCGEDAIVRENTIRTGYYGDGVTVKPGSVNALVALNDIAGIERSIVVDGAYNTAVIYNRAVAIFGTDNTSIYVVDNRLGGFVDLNDNDYVICDGNTYAVDGLDHGLVDIDNTNKNGKDITNINARPEVGANEDLLPHTNKDLFVGMDRKTLVTDASMTTAKGLNAYLKECAAKGDIVIVPPGAYSVPSTVTIDSSCSNTTVYAYGVYSECSETNIANYEMFLYFIDRVTNFNLYGLTVGTILPTSGQVRVVDRYILVNGKRYENEMDIPVSESAKPREYKLTILTDAGFMDGFTKATPELYHTFWPETFLYENGEHKLYPEENPDNFHECVYNYDENGNYDGTMTYTIKNKAGAKGWEAKDIYSRIQRGTIMTCRLAYGNHIIYTYGSKNVNIRDFVLYGYSGGMANVGMQMENVKYERFHNALHGETLIDEETYNKYLALEEKWGVDMEVREETLPDGTVRYRGPASRSGSIDGFHTTSSKHGYEVVSSLLEGMVDDGANQKGNSSRLWDVRDNGDGTVTIEYQDTAIVVAGGTHSTRWCANFKKGDIVFIYASSGQVLCETPALTDYTVLGNNSYTLTVDGVEQKYSRYSVTVAADAVNWDALTDPVTGERYNFQNANMKHSDKNVVVVDNLTYNACGFTMDNVKVNNGHSRGFLIKATDVVIKHCTFSNVSYAALLITAEPSWGESTLPRRILIQQCLFDNTGYMSNLLNDKEFACISIFATSTVPREDMLPLEDITITGCKFTNNRHKYAIYLNSVKNVTITNNIFDDVIPSGIDKYDNFPNRAVFLEVCANIEISDNTYNYSHFKGDITNVIFGVNYINIFGTDVTDENGNKLVPDKVITNP